MKRILLSLLVLCFTSQLHAQSSEHHWGFSINPGVYSFYALENGLFNGEDYGGGVQFGFMKSAGASFDLGLNIDAGVVRHSANAEALIPQQRDNFFSGQLVLRYKFDNGYILEQDAIVSPFIKLGIGGNSYVDLSNFALHAPIGAGLQVRIPKSPIRVIAQTAYNVGIQGESFVHHSLGVGINFGRKDNSKKNKDKDEPKDLLGQNLADTDYDGIPDEKDRCPYIFGTVKTGGCPDSDGDGVKDSEDKCPDVAGFANLLGCNDSDYDGVIDPNDACPNEYGDKMNDGCPEGKSGVAEDRDGDGIPDSEDACPDEKGFFTAQGCPDKDGDGIQDKDDDCPDHYGVAEHNGCPIPLEELQRLTGLYKPKENPDGTIGYTDTGYKGQEGEIQIGEPTFENPNSAYSFQGNGNNTTGNYTGDPGDPDNPYGNYPNSPQEGDPDYPYPYTEGPAPSMGENVTLTGFPDPSLDDEEYCDRLALAKFKAAIYFDYDESQIDVVSRRYLGQIVQAMRRCATFELQVAGHTDSDGSATYNLKLSERRAKAVLNYIQDANVNDKRLKYNGYGEQYPQAPNTSDDNKRLNRRAEIRLIRGPQY